MPREEGVGGREGGPDWDGCLGGALWETLSGRCIWVVVGPNSFYIVACKFWVNLSHNDQISFSE